MHGGDALRVLVADDVLWWRTTLCSSIGALGHELVPPEGCASVQSVELALTGEDQQGRSIDLVVLDLQMPYRLVPDVAPADDDGADLGHWIHRHYPDTRIVVVTKNEAGKAAVLCRDFSQVILEKTVVAGEDGAPLAEAITAAMRGEVLLRVRDHEGHRARIRRQFSFTNRELELLELLAKGRSRSNLDLARELGVSDRAIESHKRNIAEKIRRVEAMALRDAGIADGSDARYVLAWFLDSRLTPPEP